MKPTVAPFPAARLRRTRVSPAIRGLVRENTLTTDDLIWPVFVRDGEGIVEPVVSMPGVVRRSVDKIAEAAVEAQALGIPAICLFPYTDPALKTEDCAEAWNPDNLCNRAIRAIKAVAPEIAVMTDVALDPYNINGHDGFVVDGEILNDETVEALVKMTLAQAEAGADIIGPSDMMDGRIAAMRSGLEQGGHRNVSILSYSAKYASGFYGPFRDAVGASGALKGDKKTYQMDPGNSDEALRLVERDLQEGADMVMVKPGIAYLDICHRVKTTFGTPTFAYQVSGEYAMIQAAAQNGWINGEQVMLESLLAFKRAGCDGILTYFAPETARILNG
ncbi:MULTISPECIES: porphobilinogen synthase [Rhodobacterales]|jgi:porphobilinogen synthase|uniref:Delta-aminolevulinic acid dehydratase n=1 Tax=Phaeobacter gallaeciensis TaxID=60890 RepID=A0A1B0ZLM8_9RHOB|nr:MULTISPECIES: porphobilinogen synthase [Phaeobacter]MEE2634496.1 porphobilinogen synthase [Pseudomonadota bacterium]ANP35058.1 delta-aminolevulinic acid dehydratase [Phaeobacter gallaeciensis]MDE4062721.1 porphobilinogen synthase [Phaeobacter gallaeciensis]MDE4096423.1 porphobilinogen synthase [Phaeobacter gallaeciensis]MDE4105234.1 porphobilinogen synthase [Phaeobacter gallaeciensis]